ncbi:carboxypeptidase regulatory-like domain-containing protein [Psychroserpens sp. NJDZ02]|nr:carboxypeptidase regulatory-like domain-containing protein [Psychroserpens sp. NJDZ02]
MKTLIQNRKISLIHCCFVPFILISFYSCSTQQSYSAKISKFQPSFRGEIKENSMKGVSDTTVVFINGKVNNYDKHAGKGIELTFTSEENNQSFKTITDSIGQFQITIASGLYKLQLIPYRLSRTPTLNFENLKYKSGDIRQLKIYTELSAETVALDTVFKNKKAYIKYLRR